MPTSAPSLFPTTSAPSLFPTTSAPSLFPTTSAPSTHPSHHPTNTPIHPTTTPSSQPSFHPSSSPSTSPDFNSTRTNPYLRPTTSPSPPSIPQHHQTWWYYSLSGLVLIPLCLLWRKTRQTEEDLKEAPKSPFQKVHVVIDHHQKPSLPVRHQPTLQPPLRVILPLHQTPPLTKVQFSSKLVDKYTFYYDEEEEDTDLAPPNWLRIKRKIVGNVFPVSQRDANGDVNPTECTSQGPSLPSIVPGLHHGV